MPAASTVRMGGKMQALIRDYAVAEPSFTVKFAAWELGVSYGSVWNVTQDLLDRGIITMIEAKSGAYGAVYAYAGQPKPERSTPTVHKQVQRRRVKGGSAVPHTGKAIGPSGKPGMDRKHSALGKRVKRARQGT